MTRNTQGSAGARPWCLTHQVGGGWRGELCDGGTRNHALEISRAGRKEAWGEERAHRGWRQCPRRAGRLW